jgi:decaprenylphospho-beta-D-erythro-pentofuranosid-2-ulose 2-reductase
VNDALGEPQSVLVLGGTSEIALETVKALPRARIRRVVLAGRPSPARDEAVAALTSDGIAGVSAVDFDAKETGSHADLVNAIFDAGDIDITLLAFGILGNQDDAEADPDHAIDVATTNYTGAVSVGLRVAARLKAQGHGAIVVMSSVAGVRARKDNFVYGSTKAGLDAFAQGLGDSLVGTGVRVMVVRPGFVHTKMTEGMDAAPFSTTPDKVAQVIVDGLAAGRETVWAPGILKFPFAGFRMLPRAVWRKVAERG